MTLKTLLVSGILAAGAAAPALAAEEYVFDQSHTQILFEYQHLGYSITQGSFTEWAGTLLVDEADPSASSLDVTIQTASLYTGFADRDTHFLSGDFFNAEVNPTITFVSTGVEQTSENTLAVAGDMTINGITQPVTFDVVVNQLAPHPMSEIKTLGFTATTEVKRTDFDLGMFAPYVSDEVSIRVSGEAALKSEAGAATN